VSSDKVYDTWCVRDDCGVCERVLIILGIILLLNRGLTFNVHTRLDWQKVESKMRQEAISCVE